MQDISALMAEPEVVITEKMDGKTPPFMQAAAIRAARMRAITGRGTG
ncbi:MULTISPECIES: hypothetical protein [Leisingera]